MAVGRDVAALGRIAGLRPSRRALRALLRTTGILDGIGKVASYVVCSSKRKPNRANGMLKWLGLSLLLGAGCGSVAWAQGSTRFDGQYVGELTLTGIINGDCTEPPVGALYPLTISRGQVRFKYVPRFDTTLVG